MILSIILSVLYLLIINYYVFNLYLGATTADIYNYIYNINKSLQQGTVLDDKFYFYSAIIYIYSWFDFKDPFKIYVQIFSVTIFLLSYKLFLNVFHLKKRLIPFILVVLILFTPSVFELIASNIRSGVALVIFLYGIKSNTRLIKLILIFISVLIHFMVLPILSLYILFYSLKKIGIVRRSTSINILLLIFTSLTFCLITKFNFYTSGYQYGFLFSILVYFITILFTYFYSKVIANEDGFVAIGLMFMISISSFLDINLMRYLGVAFILYGIFIINTNNINIIKKYTSFYFILVIIYQIYFFRNLMFYGYI